jgi:hypothetical protein
LSVCRIKSRSSNLDGPLLGGQWSTAVVFNPFCPPTPRRIISVVRSGLWVYNSSCTLYNLHINETHHEFFFFFPVPRKMVWCTPRGRLLVYDVLMWRPPHRITTDRLLCLWFIALYAVSYHLDLCSLCSAEGTNQHSVGSIH